MKNLIDEIKEAQRTGGHWSIIERVEETAKILLDHGRKTEAYHIINLANGMYLCEDADYQEGVIVWTSRHTANQNFCDGYVKRLLESLVAERNAVFDAAPSYVIVGHLGGPRYGNTKFETLRDAVAHRDANYPDYFIERREVIA